MMKLPADYVIALSPALGLAVNVLVQVLGYRFSRSRNLLKSIFIGFGFGMVFMLLIDASLHISSGEKALEALSLSVLNVMTYGALGFGYFNFVNLGTTARRIRMLVELKESGDGLTYEGLFERYNAREMVERRLRRLLDSGQIVKRDGRLFIGVPFVLIISRFIVWMKVFYLGKRSELE